jgi:hypothetical protein
MGGIAVLDKGQVVFRAERVTEPLPTGSVVGTPR